MAKKSEKRQKRRNSDLRIERVLVENFVSLQKVMVNLSVKLESLTSQISKLLNLFEISAKALAEKNPALEKEDKNTRSIADKVDSILEQNKIIARGLTLLHEPPSLEPTVLEPPRYEPPRPEPQGYEPNIKQNFQQIRQPLPPPKTSLGVERYQKSMSSKNQEEFGIEETR